MGSNETKAAMDDQEELDESKESFQTLSTCELKVKAKSEPEKLELGDWKRILSPQEYSVTRLKGTERAFTSAMNDVKEEGTFLCSSCDIPVFDSSTKYDSGSGWPSFYAPINREILSTTTDYEIGSPRTEVHCARCKAHFGHVFNDGPRPTGLRYCMNGASLKFQPKTS